MEKISRNKFLSAHFGWFWSSWGGFGSNLFKAQCNFSLQIKMKGLTLGSSVNYWNSVDSCYFRIYFCKTHHGHRCRRFKVQMNSLEASDDEKLRQSICFRRKSKPVGSKTANVAFEINKYRDCCEFFLAHWTELLFLHEQRILKQALERSKRKHLHKPDADSLRHLTMRRHQNKQKFYARRFHGSVVCLPQRNLRFRDMLML